MAIVTTATIQAALSWTQTDTPNSSVSTSTTIDDMAVSYAKGLADGTGNSQIDNVWHLTTGVLPSGGQTVLNLNNLDRTTFGSSLESSMSGVKAIIVENKSSGDYGNIIIRATGSQGLTDIFNGETGTAVAPPLSPWMAVNYVAGWAISPTNNEIQLVDGAGSGISYKIGVVGTK